MEQTPNPTLRQWLENAPYNLYRAIYYEIMDGCHVTRQTVDNWLAGRTQPDALAREKINAVARKYARPIPFDNEQ